MSCVFPTATFHAISCSEIFADDVVKPCSFQDVHAGFVRVTDAPGLGVQLDYDALERTKRNVPDPSYDMPWIARSVLRSVPFPTYMYHLIQPSGKQRENAEVDWYRRDGTGGPPGAPRTAYPSVSIYRSQDEAEAADFAAVKQRIQDEGSVLIKGALPTPASPLQPRL